MADFNIAHVPALGGVRRGRLGRAAPAESGVRISAMPEGRVLQILAANGRDLEADLRAAGLGDVRFCSLGQWFIVADQPASDGDFDTLRQTLGDAAMVSDQSHGRVRIEVAGSNACDLLVKGSAVDLDDAVFPVGRSAMTLFGHIGINLARTGESAFELIGLRGFAESLWNELIHMGLEYGVDCRSSLQAAK